MDNNTNKTTNMMIYRCTGDGDIVLLHDRYQNT